jgi:cellulose biosynthesis protein BcsQ
VVLSMLDRNALKGAMALLDTVTTLKSKGIGVKVTAVLRNAVNSRRVTYQALNDALLADKRLPLLKTEIPLTADFNNATTAGEPLLTRAPHSEGAEAIREAAKEFLTQLAKRRT